MAKQMLTAEAIESQAILELPDRKLPALIVITNLLNNNTVTIDIRNVDVAVQVCAKLIATGNFTCTVNQ